MYYGILTQSVTWDGLSRYSRPQSWWALKGILRLAVMFAIAFPISYMRNIEEEKLWVKRFVNSTMPLFMIFFYTFGMCDAFCACFRLYRVKGPSCQPIEPSETRDEEEKL